MGKSSEQSSIVGDQIALFVISNTAKDGRKIAARDYPLMDCYRLMHAYFTGITTGHVMFNGFDSFEAFLKYHALATFDDLRYAYSAIPDWLTRVLAHPDVSKASRLVADLEEERRNAFLSHLIRDYHSEITEAERKFEIMRDQLAADWLGSYGKYPEVPSCNSKITGTARVTEYGNLDYTWRAFHQPYDDDAKFFLDEIDGVERLLRMNHLDIIGRFEIGIAVPKEVEAQKVNDLEALIPKSHSDYIRSDFTLGTNTHWAEGEDGTACTVIGYVFSRE